MGKIGTEVILTEQEQKVAAYIADQRQKNNEENKSKNAKISPKSDLKISYEGVCGEIAFCKLFNVCPDFTIEARVSKDDAGDATLFGKTIDVKTIARKDGNLLAVPWSGKKGEVDAYALFNGESPIFIFRGFITKKDLIKDENIRDFTHGDTYSAYHAMLCEFEDLKFE